MKKEPDEFTATNILLGGIVVLLIIIVAQMIGVQELLLMNYRK